MITLDLDSPEELKLVNGRIKFALGLDPGQPNQGLTAERKTEVAARLAGFDDSGWATPKSIRDSVSTGLTFGWYRFTITLPEKVRGLPVAGAQVWFEASIDDYGEVWADYPGPDLKPAAAIAAQKLSPVIGYNGRNRLLIAREAKPGQKHVIACLAVNAPLANPLGSIFIRYARLEICQGMGKVPFG